MNHQCIAKCGWRNCCDAKRKGWVRARCDVWGVSWNDMFHQGGDSSSFHDDHSLPLDGTLPASLYEAADFLLRDTAPLIKDDSNLERPCSSCLASSCVCNTTLLPELPSTSSTASKCSICQGTTDLPALRMAHEVICLSMAFCHLCCVTFSSELAKELHMVREHSSMHCLECGGIFSSEFKLASHLAKEHAILRCPCCDQQVTEDLEDHFASNHNSLSAKQPFLCRPDFSCSLCLADEKFITKEVSEIMTHLLKDHGVKQEKALLFLCRLDIDSDDEDVGDDILVPLVNLFASSESSSDEDESENLEEHFGFDQLDVDPEDIDCVSQSSEEDLDISSLECELCEDKVCISPRELCLHLNEEHKVGWDKKSETDCRSADYGCYLCTFKCSAKGELKSHLANDHTHLGNKCRFCPVRFISHEDRDKHQLDQHFDQQHCFYHCPVCQHISTSTAIAQKHIKESHPNENMRSRVKYKCRICHQLFPSLLLMRSHFSSWHLGTMVYRCRLCSATLKTKKTLTHHIKVVHSEIKKRDCSICNKEFLNKRAYTIHFRMKHNKGSKVGFRCRICQQKFDTKEERKLHYTIDHEGESPYHCSDCGKGFASKSGMYGHRQLHTGSGISKCEYCGKEFTRKDSYNEHLLIHNGPRHKCPHCTKEFVQRSNLVRHIRIHTGEKPYQCTYCEKKFSDKGACNSHIRVHTREEMCSCPYCGQTFSKKQKLKYHIRKHTGEGLMECEICNKMFTNSFALKEHRIIHNRQTQVVCPQCGKGFNSEKYLQRHVSIVHEPTSKSFKCSLCTKTFSQQARLKAHVMTHSGVKHMKCLLCDKAYSVRKSLRRHLMEKHEIGPEDPRYKQSFHAMSPEEAGLSVADTDTTTPPPESTSGKKRRRVEQIVQNLQNSLSTTQQPAQVAPLVIINKRKVRKKKQVDRATSSSSVS